MDIQEALAIVLSLARGNIISHDEMPEDYELQTLACNMVEDMAVNQFGDT